MTISHKFFSAKAISNKTLPEREGIHVFTFGSGHGQGVALMTRGENTLLTSGLGEKMTFLQGGVTIAGSYYGEGDTFSLDPGPATEIKIFCEENTICTWSYSL